ncbi:MAG: CinA family protein [Bdellovibrionales bacterium]|nr:CinA family protein [Bdellovibrionales bacterium]
MSQSVVLGKTGHGDVDKWGDKISHLRFLLRQRQWTLGLAESCTGGLLSSWVTQISGASDFFCGAIVCYHRRVKENILDVPQHILKTMGEVSSPTARHMAVGAQMSLQCDVALAITGIAGPAGGSVEKPVGTVCFAVVAPGFAQELTHYFPKHWSRGEIQQAAAHFGLDLLVRACE